MVKILTENHQFRCDAILGYSHQHHGPPVQGRWRGPAMASSACRRNRGHFRLRRAPLATAVNHGLPSRLPGGTCHQVIISGRSWRAPSRQRPLPGSSTYTITVNRGLPSLKTFSPASCRRTPVPQPSPALPGHGTIRMPAEPRSFPASPHTICRDGKPRFTFKVARRRQSPSRHFRTILASAFTPAAASSIPARNHRNRTQPCGSISPPPR